MYTRLEREEIMYTRAWAMVVKEFSLCLVVKKHKNEQ